MINFAKYTNVVESTLEVIMWHLMRHAEDNNIKIMQQSYPMFNGAIKSLADSNNILLNYDHHILPCFDA